MLTRDEADRRVARGAAELDRISPGWDVAIDLGHLDMESCTRCILGQRFGSFVSAGEEYFRMASPTGWGPAVHEMSSEDPVVACGFAVIPADSDTPSADDTVSSFTYISHDQRGMWQRKIKAAYAVLQDAWVDLIARRRTAVVQATELVAAG